MVKIDKSWDKILHIDLFHKIIDTLDSAEFIPPKSKLLIPFSYFKLNQLKIVILGEEPYANPDLSNGLAFSVNKGVTAEPNSSFHNLTPLHETLNQLLVGASNCIA